MHRKAELLLAMSTWSCSLSTLNSELASPLARFSVVLQHCLEHLSSPTAIREMKKVAAKVSPLEHEKIRSAYTAFWLVEKYMEQRSPAVKSAAVSLLTCD